MKSLQLLLEHAEAGRESAVSLLERLGREGREKPRVIDAERDLASFLRLIRAGYRGEGILMPSSLLPGVRFSARKSEVEQILHNLVRNAVESLRWKGIAEQKLVEISSRRRDGQSILEVKDNAGGVTPAAARRLFAPRYSETRRDRARAVPVQEPRDAKRRIFGVRPDERRERLQAHVPRGHGMMRSIRRTPSG